MLNVRNRMFLAVAHLLGICLLLLGCATEEAAIQSQTPLEGLDLELVGGRLEIQNPMPRNGEEVEVMVIVRNRGNQDAKRVPVFFYDNLRVFSTEEIDLEPGGQRRLSARWRATMGSHILSVALDPAHHLKEMKRGKSEVSTNVLVK
jgi:subtilase family serine protease